MHVHLHVQTHVRAWRIHYDTTHIHPMTIALISADDMRPYRPIASFFRPLRSSAVTAALSTDAFCRTCAVRARMHIVLITPSHTAATTTTTNHHSRHATAATTTVLPAAPPSR